MNISEVARRAQVSIATVSRVMNGSAYVMPETAQRVRQAIQELDFLPDGNARTLGSGRSGLYGLIISDITNPYFPELVKAFEDLAVENGREVLIANTNYDAQRMEACVVRMLQRKVDGIAVMTSEMDAGLVATLSKRQIPTVFLDAPGTHSGTSVVRIDYEAGIQAAMDHLFALGHRRVGFISGPLSLCSSRRRLEAFRTAMARRSLAVEAGWVQESDHRVEGGHQATTRLLRSSTHLPTAVVASNDLACIGILGALRAASLRVPEDISLVGFDGIELSAYMQPALTTLLVSRSELAAKAFDCLGVSRLSSSHGNCGEAVITPRLLVRRSTGPASH